MSARCMDENKTDEQFSISHKFHKLMLCFNGSTRGSSRERDASGTARRTAGLLNNLTAMHERIGPGSPCSRLKLKAHQCRNSSMIHISFIRELGDFRRRTGYLTGAGTT